MRLTIAVGLLGLLIMRSGSLRAEGLYQLIPALELGSGLDTDPASDATTTGRGLGRKPKGEEAAGLLHLAPRLTSHLARDGHRLDAAYDFLLRAPTEGESLIAHSVTVGYRPPALGQLELEASLIADVTRAGELGTALFGAGFGVSYGRGPTRGSAVVRAMLREDRPGDGSSAPGTGFDATLGGEILPARGVSVTAAYVFGTIESDADVIDESRHRAVLALRVVRGRLELSARYAFALAQLPQGTVTGERHDTVHDTSVGVEWSLSQKLELFVRGQASFQRGDDGSEDTRVLALGGVGFHLDWTRLEHTPVPRAVEFVGGRAHFRLRAPGASQVAVIGDFNEWDPLRGTMNGQAGVFTLDIPLAAGRYSWTFQVDGRSVDPVGMPLADDGFGGRSAILIVESDD